MVAAVVAAVGLGAFASLSCGDSSGGTPADGAVSFAATVSPLLTSRCLGCHRASGGVAASSFALTGDPAQDYAVVRQLVTPSEPAASPLLVAATGVAGHGGGEQIAPGSREYAEILEWISSGAVP